MEIDIQGLELEWHLMLEPWDAGEDVSKRTFQYLVDQYSSEKRHYHTLVHINDMRLLARRYKSAIHCEDTVFFATWFHDAIQEMGIDSEAESAKLAIKMLGALNLPSSIIHNVYQLIMATKQYAKVNAQDGNLFIDIDMAILGASREVYEAYRLNCRKEYSVTDELYKLGRTQFLQGVLNQEHIYLTALFRDKYQDQAIMNIKHEISLHAK